LVLVTFEVSPLGIPKFDRKWMRNKIYSRHNIFWKNNVTGHWRFRRNVLSGEVHQTVTKPITYIS